MKFIMFFLILLMSLNLFSQVNTDTLHFADNHITVTDSFAVYQKLFEQN